MSYDQTRQFTGVSSFDFTPNAAGLNSQQKYGLISRMGGRGTTVTLGGVDVESERRADISLALGLG